MRALTETDKINICEIYKTKTISDIAKQYKIGEKRVKSILLENSIEIRVPTKKIKDNEWNYNDELRKRFPPEDGYSYAAKEKTSGKIFKDYLNASGALTQYLKEIGIAVPSLYKRTKFFKENGYQWYEQWFDIVKEKDEYEYKKCPYCDWQTKDINNNSGAFLNHILKEHGISKEEHLKHYQEDRVYFRLANKTLDRQMESDEEKFVVCKICGKKLSRIDWKHLVKHGLTKEEYIEKYGPNTVSNVLKDLSRKNVKIANMNMVPTYTSKAEKEIMEYITNNGGKCEKNRKILKGKEIDIYVPDKKIGIEYDGIRWHSQWYGKKQPFFHLEKTNLCKNAGIKLIHIFEDEYTYKKDIVLNKISHILGISDDCEKIMGRKCVIKEIDNYTAAEFLDKFHIQGSTSFSVSYGAFYNGNLVAVMSFKRKKADSNNEWELVRFASDYSYVCQGVGGKLFKHFIREFSPEKVLSFADRRWTINEDKNVYTCLGFKNDGYTKPSYYYINTKISKHRFHKFGFRKERLLKKYGDRLSPNMTESEMAKALGFDRIWDCGLIRYVWKKQ